MPSIKFSELWANHPTTKGDNSPCKKKDGTDAFENQCAIRMGVALSGAGLSLTGYHGVKCWFGHGGAHTLRVEEMIDWLKTQSGSVGVYVQYTGSQPELGQKIKKELAGKTGIVAWRNFWGRGGQGDHIDLWDGRVIREGNLDYFDRSKDMYFWHIA